MITDADVKKLKTAFKDAFATKEDLTAMEQRMDKKNATKEDLKDLRSQINDDIDGKLKNHEEKIIKGVGEYVTDIIVPMFEERDEKIERLEKKVGISSAVS